MSKNDLTEIVFVLDTSGSMQVIQEDAIGGFNSFLSDQKKAPGEALFTLTLFDTSYDLVHQGVPIRNVPDLNSDSYRPGGMTALLDAFGRTIDEVGKRLADMPDADRPGKVIMAVMTDGLENSSQEYTREQVFEKAKHQQEKYGWEIIYLGANQDAIKQGGLIGTPEVYTCGFAATPAGIKSAYRTASDAVTRGRAGGTAEVK